MGIFGDREGKRKKEGRSKEIHPDDLKQSLDLDLGAECAVRIQGDLWVHSKD
jgi:hypothetical protein